MSKLVFLDTETTGLADDCEIWEIGLIARTVVDLNAKDGIAAQTRDIEYSWQLVPDMRTAEPTGLRIGRYYERQLPILRNIAPGQGIGDRAGGGSTGVVHTALIAGHVARLLDGATIVGAVPNFDTQHLTRWLRSYNQSGTWHYHLVDVETLAAGALRKPPPWGFDDLLATFGLTYDEADRHTALGDARMVRDLYDAVLAGQA